ncbi:MAG: toprim domain-containing protein [Acidobacteriia bacterium]|nr:toprim domain-containing protein [Terriglobia bacterium]
MKRLPAGFILQVAAAADREVHQRQDGDSEPRIRCPWSERHHHNDAHPSCRLNPEKNTWFCDPCGRGGGVKDLAAALAVDLSSLIPTLVGATSMPTTRSTRTKKEDLRFVSSGPISPAVQARFKDSLGKAYTEEAWRALGVEEGTVNDEPAIAFPLPSDGRKVCLYRHPDPKRDKPYSFRFSNGGKADLLIVGDGKEVLLVAGEWDMLAALSAGFPHVATGTGGEGAWKDAWSKRFAGKIVFVIYDVDEVGGRGAQKVAAALEGTAACVVVVRLPLSGDPERDGKDLSDYLALHSANNLRTLLANASHAHAGLLSDA